MYYNSRNMNYIYNKEFFKKIMAPNSSADDVKTAGAEIYNFVFPKEGYVAYQEMKKYANKRFSLYTIYPGLMIGSGYPHASGESNSIVGGFSFDHVTGLPIIPGSTVKGMLRSYILGTDSEKNQEREKLICEILGKKVDIDAFVETLFEKDNVFLGAYPVIKEQEKVFASEYITPHKDPLKNPVPLSMLKVREGIEYEFLFKLSKYEDSEITISEEELKNFFKELLLFGGIGAKTNVGFGQFSETMPKAKPESKKIQELTESVIHVVITGYDEKKRNALFEEKNGKKKGRLFYKNVEAEYGKIDKKIKLNAEYDVYSKKELGNDGNTYTNWYIKR